MNALIRTWNLPANPIFRRYCRSRLRPRGLGIAALLCLMAAGFLFSISRSAALYRGGMTLAEADRAPLIPLLVMQAAILFVLGTAQVAGGMTAERDEGIIDYQRLIPMPPLAKALGYLIGLPVREWVLFLITLPLTAWSIWRGGVPLATWGPIYGVLLTSAILYHLTGLVTGTVVRNRRWAFLISIGVVFSLYTIVPQAARFGLVFFKYLTITPVLHESLPGLLPEAPAELLRLQQRFAPAARFYNLDFPEAVFTVFSQSGLILTFLVMLRRRWRSAESLLLGKLWAPGLFLWIQILLLGNALPLVDSGRIFPSREIANFTFAGTRWSPAAAEAVGMAAAYGLVTRLLLLLLAHTITPDREMQIRGWRRAKKQGANRLPPLADGATAFWPVLAMALAGAAGWYLFTRGVVESRWFPGQTVPPQVAAYFALVMLSGGLAFHALLEWRGTRAVAMAAIFAGVLPVLVGTVLVTIDDRFQPVGAWAIGMSPAAAPIFATAGLLEIADLPAGLARAVPLASYFWQFVTALAACWLIAALRKSRKAIARETLDMSREEMG